MFESFLPKLAGIWVTILSQVKSWSNYDRETHPPSDPTTATSHFTAEPTGNSRMTLCRCFRSLQTRQCPTLPGSQSVKVYCRQETPQEEQEGSSEMHYFHQKNAVDLIKEFEDLLGEFSYTFLRNVAENMIWNNQLHFLIKLYSTVWKLWCTDMRYKTEERLRESTFTQPRTYLFPHVCMWKKFVLT